MDFDNIEPKPVTHRQSSVKCALACERCWFYRYRMGVVLRGAEKKDAATLGQIYHKLQQHGPGQEDEARKWVAQQQRDLMALVEAGEDLDGNAQHLANNLTSLYKKAEVMAHIFWEKFPQPPQFETVGTEIKHTMEFDGLTLEGTIDKLLSNKMNFWIRDHKSTGRSLDAIFGGIAWSIQARMYRILAEDYLATEHGKQVLSTKEFLPIVRGFILDGIMTPGIKLCKTDEKNAKQWNVSVEDAYLRRVKEWYRDYEVKADLGGKQSTKAIDSKAIMFTEPLYPRELKEVFGKMWALQELPPYPEAYSRDVTRTACFAWGRKCIYYDLCETDPKQWGRLFETKYKISEGEKDEEEEIEREETKSD